jgi:hypothetical protein
MDAIHRKQVRIGGLARWRIALWSLVLLTACGGETGHGRRSTSPGSGGVRAAAGGGGSAAAGRGNGDTGGIGAATGGVESQGGGGLTGTLSNGGAEVGTGGALFQGGSGGAGATDDCQEQWWSLWTLIAVIGIGGFGQCAPLEPDAPLGPGTGAVVLDDEGRIVAAQGVYVVAPDELDAWGLGDKRFPCHAGRTIKYRCTSSI